MFQENWYPGNKQILKLDNFCYKMVPKTKCQTWGAATFKLSLFLASGEGLQLVKIRVSLLYFSSKQNSNLKPWFTLFWSCFSQTYLYSSAVCSYLCLVEQSVAGIARHRFPEAQIKVIRSTGIIHNFGEISITTKFYLWKDV